MSAKEPTHTNHAARSRYRAPVPTTENLAGRSERHSNLAAFIQGPGAAPGAVLANSMRQLQRTIGNQAVGRLLRQTLQDGLSEATSKQSAKAVVQRERESNPHASGGSHEGWNLTAHHIIAHTKLVEGFDALEPAQQKQLLIASIPEKLTVSMMDNLKVTLNDEERLNPEPVLAGIRSQLVDPEFQSPIRNIRVEDIRGSFFEWMGGNQFFGPNTSIRPEPSSSKDDIDTDGRFFTGADYGKLKKQGDALYKRLGNKGGSKEKRQEEILNILLEIVKIAKDVTPAAFDPAAWVEIGSLEKLQKLASNGLLNRRHILDYAYFKLPTPPAMGAFPEPFSALRAVNAGVSEFDYGAFKQVPSQVGNNLAYFSLSGSKTVVSSSTVTLSVNDAIGEIASRTGKKRSDLLTRREDHNYDLKLDPSQYTIVGKTSIRLNDYERLFSAISTDPTIVITPEALNTVIAKKVPGVPLYDYLVKGGAPTSSYLPKQVYDAFDRQLPALEQQVQLAEQKEDNLLRRYLGLSKMKPTKNTLKSLALTSRQHEKAQQYTIKSRKQLKDFQTMWKS